MKRRYDLYLKDILTAIQKAKNYTSNLEFKEFKKDDKTIDAVVWNLGLIGEAVSQIKDEVKDKHPQVPWQKIKDFRNIAYHKYHALDLEIIWDIVQNKLDSLEENVNTILEEDQD